MSEPQQRTMSTTTTWSMSIMDMSLPCVLRGMCEHGRYPLHAPWLKRC